MTSDELMSSATVCVHFGLIFSLHNAEKFRPLFSCLSESLRLTLLDLCSGVIGQPERSALHEEDVTTPDDADCQFADRSIRHNRGAYYISHFAVLC